MGAKLLIIFTILLILGVPVGFALIGSGIGYW